MVAHLTPDQKGACSNHVRVNDSSPPLCIVNHSQIGQGRPSNSVFYHLENGY